MRGEISHCPRHISLPCLFIVLCLNLPLTKNGVTVKLGVSQILEKEESYTLEKENRLRVLPYNPYFKEEVKKVRQLIGSFARASQFIGVIRSWELLTKQPSVKEAVLHGNINPANYVVTHAHALHLMERFNLPHTFSVFLHVLSYMVEGRFPMQNEERLNTFIIDDSTEPDDLILGVLTWRRGIAFQVDEYTTKKELNSLWLTVAAIRDRLRDLTGLKPPQRRRKGKKWERQQDRWLEWYKLYKELGSPEKVANYLSIQQVQYKTKMSRSISNLFLPGSRVPTAEAIRKGIDELKKLWQPIR